MSRRPHLLVLQRTYPPMAGAAGDLLADLCEHLVRKEGWRVTVVCGGKGAVRLADKVRVTRAVALPYFRKSLPLRALSTLSLYPAMHLAAAKTKDPDAVLSLSDPPLISTIGDRIARARSIPHVVWGQDLYPEVAVAAGVLRAGGAVERILRKFAKRALRRASRVILPGRCMRENLTQVHGEGVASVVIPNWSLPATSQPTASEIRSLRGKLAPAASKLLLYAGNLGRVHEFETILTAMSLLNDSAWHLAVVGSGNQERAVRKRIHSLPNVSLHAPITRDDLPIMLAAADVHLVTLAEPFAGLVVPSKTITAIGAGKPVIFIGPRRSEAARFLEETGSGRVFGNGDSREIAATLREQQVFESPFRAESIEAAKVAALNPRETSLRQITDLLRTTIDQRHGSQ